MKARLKQPLLLGSSEQKLGAESDWIAQEALLETETLLMHNLKCVEDNKTRLKQVKNLEELINFRIKTVLGSETVNKESRLSQLRDVDVLLANRKTPTRH